VREHLGSKPNASGLIPAIARTTPALLGLLSLVTVLALPDFSHVHGEPPYRKTTAQVLNHFAFALCYST
jgi:hypothetical protein